MSPNRTSTSDLNSSITSLKRKASRQNAVANLSEPLSNTSSQAQDQSKNTLFDNPSTIHETRDSDIAQNVMKQFKDNMENDYSADSNVLTTPRNGAAKDCAPNLPAHPVYENSEFITSVVSFAKPWFCYNLTTASPTLMTMVL